MKLNRMTGTIVLAASLLGGAAIAQISDAKHPHMAAAQKYGKMAYQEITQAQQANGNQLGGHAQKAKDLLEQANHEMDMAAQESNQNHR